MTKLSKAATEAARRYGALALPMATFEACVESIARRRAPNSRPTTAEFDAIIGSLALPDLFLAIACDAGIAGAWDAFTRTHGARLAEMALRHGATAADAHQIAAELPGELCQPPGRSTQGTRIGGFDGTGSLDAWLEVLVARRVIDRLRARARGGQESQADVAAPESSDPSRQAADEDDRSQFERSFRAAWATLPPREALAVRARYGEALDQAAIARLLGVSQPTVSRLLASAVTRLRQALARGGLDPGSIGHGYATALEHTLRVHESNNPPDLTSRA